MKHETLLTYFDSGWEALSPTMQSPWLPHKPAPVLPRSVRVKSKGHITELKHYEDDDGAWDDNISEAESYVDDSEWTSWIDFPLDDIPELTWDPWEAVEYLADNMEHGASVLGLETPPENYRIRRSISLAKKRNLAEKLLHNYMQKIKSAAWEDLKARIEEEGEAAWRLLL
jgi:hypothetical protein